MYLIVIHVPFQEAGTGEVRVAGDWGQSLRLLRDSLQGRFGPMVVAAPAVGQGFEWTEQQSVSLRAKAEDIHFVKLCDANLRARQFWRQARRVYHQCLDLARKAEVVHAGMADLYRPISQMGFRAGLAAGVPTIFVEDTDVVTQIRQLDHGRNKWRTELYCRLFDRVMCWAVARADLSLLKGRSLHQRYGRFAKNARDFQDTSYYRDWIIPRPGIEEKKAQLVQSEMLRCVSIGRLVARKGVDETIRTIGLLNAFGVPTQLDIIGDGPERKALTDLAAAMNLDDRVRFSGVRSYGRELIEDLRQYHLMLFTPPAEDTPRSLFDGFAAGLPIAGYSIDFVQSLLATEQCGIAVAGSHSRELAREIQGLWRDRERFCGLIEKAVTAGYRNSADSWYARRAEWTFEIVEEAKARGGKPARTNTKKEGVE